MMINLLCVSIVTELSLVKFHSASLMQIRLPDAPCMIYLPTLGHLGDFVRAYVSRDSIYGAWNTSQM